MKTYSLLLFLFLFSSCDFVKTFRENAPEDKKEAQKVTEKFYTLLKENNKPEIFKLFSNDFFKATKKEEFEQFIDWASKEEKTFSQHVLIDAQTMVEKGTNAKSEYTLIYNAQRGNLKTREEFGLKKDADNTIKIYEYKINAQPSK